MEPANGDLIGKFWRKYLESEPYASPDMIGVFYSGASVVSSLLEDVLRKGATRKQVQDLVDYIHKDLHAGVKQARVGRIRIRRNA